MLGKKPITASSCKKKVSDILVAFNTAVSSIEAVVESAKEAKNLSDEKILLEKEENENLKETIKENENLLNNFKTLLNK